MAQLHAMDRYHPQNDHQSPFAGHALRQHCHPQSIPAYIHAAHTANALVITSDPSQMALQPQHHDQSVPLSEQQARESSSQPPIEANPSWDLVPQPHWANPQAPASYPLSVHQPQPDVTTRHRGASSQQAVPERRNSRHGPLGGPTATAPFLKDFNLVAEAAKRAQMAVVLRDLESVTL